MDPSKEAVTDVASKNGRDDVDHESLSNAQNGVRKMEATTTVWSKKMLVAAYAMMWSIYFINTMQQGATNNLTPYVTSSFQEHSLTATTSVLSSLIGGLIKLPLAKLLDIWGRPQGFAVCVVVLTAGLIMMAACKNVETYAAAQVFYWVGYNGLDYTMSIFIADTSALKNRALVFAFASSPYIITTWLGGPIANSILNGPGFAWGFGIFAIVTPIITMPLFGLFMFNYYKAKNQGLMPVDSSDRTFSESCKFYFWEFDVIGLFLVIAGFGLFLLPFNLYSRQPDGWKSPMIIAMIIVGGILLILFALWEKYFAPVKFLPWELLTDRTVLGACILAGVLFISFYIWDSYFSSFLQVVNNLDITRASYIVNIYSIGSCFWSIIVGALIRYTGRFKWLALYFGVPLTILGVGLMIQFRQPDVNIGYIIMCQIFIAVAGGTLVICEQMAVMAVVEHQYVAVILAIEGMISSVGGAIGSTVAAAVWQGVFPVRLMEYLPDDAKANFTSIYGDLTTQKSYPVGSATRDAINRAYGDAQRNMLIGATAILFFAIVATAVWRDIKVKDFKQTKGNVI